MTKSLRQYNIHASNLYFVASFFTLIKGAMASHERSLTMANLTPFGRTGIFILTFLMYGCFLATVGIFLRQGHTWLKALLIIWTCITTLVFAIHFFHPEEARLAILTEYHSAPLQAVILGLDIVFSIWACVVMVQSVLLKDQLAAEEPQLSR